MKTINQFKNLRLIASLFAAITIVGCSSDDDAAPPDENTTEVITDVILMFTNAADANDVVMAAAQDPDGEGLDDLEVLGDINLSTDTEYILTFVIEDRRDADDIEDIGDEILEEDNEHQIFFSFTNDVFANPTGNGNIDTASDPLNYNDEDENGNPVGLSTTWTTTAATSAGGTFTVRLQHQPDIKSATTDANDGDTDFNLTFTLNVQ